MEDDWVEHKGGAIKLHPETRIQVRYRDGFETQPRTARKAGEYKANLNHCDNAFDVVAYRVVPEL